MLCEEEGITLNLPADKSSFKVILDDINDSYKPLGMPLECHFNRSKQFATTHMVQDYYDFKSPSLAYSNEIGASALSQTFSDNSQTAQLRNDLKHYRLRDRLEESRSADSKRYTK